MFLLVPAHAGFPGQIPQSCKTVVCVCSFVCTNLFDLYVYISCTCICMGTNIGVCRENVPSVVSQIVNEDLMGPLRFSLFACYCATITSYDQGCTS